MMKKNGVNGRIAYFVNGVIKQAID